MPKITDGVNDRSRDDTIAQTGNGIPDDSGNAVEASDEEIARVRSKLGADAPKDAKDGLEKQLERPKHGTA
jgi:hypothetical protein